MESAGFRGRWEISARRSSLTKDAWRFRGEQRPRKPKPTRCSTWYTTISWLENPGKASKPSNASCLCTSASAGTRWRFYGIRHNAAQAEYWLDRRKLDRAEEHARTLLANAEQKSAAKYIAVARRLLGEIAAVSGDAMTAEEELTRSLEPFATHPMPLIEWRNHAALGRLLAARNRPAGAREAFKRAETLVRELAGNISDPAPRKVFLEMDAVREVIAGAAG